MDLPTILLILTLGALSILVLYILAEAFNRLYKHIKKEKTKDSDIEQGHQAEDSDVGSLDIGINMLDNSEMEQAHQEEIKSDHESEVGSIDLRINMLDDIVTPRSNFQGEQLPGLSDSQEGTFSLHISEEAEVPLQSGNSEEDSEEEMKFVLYQQAPSQDYISKEESESKLLEEDRFVPPNGHRAIYEINKDETEMTMYCMGGDYPESYLKSSHNNSLVICNFKLQDGCLYQEKEEGEKSSSQIYPSFTYWTKAQTPNSLHGSYLPCLSHHAMSFIEEDLYIYGGIEREDNEPNDNMYIIKNVKKHKEKKNRMEVVLLPGQEILDSLDERPLFDINEHRIMIGDLPGRRKGHQIFTLREKLLLIGGNTTEECEDDWGHETVMCQDNLYLFDPTRDRWSKIRNQSRNRNLQRANFGSCKNPNEDTFYITGGIRIENGQTINLSIFDIVTINFQVSEQHPIITTLAINSPLELELSSPSLSWNSGKLYLYGGNTGNPEEQVEGEFVHNGNLIKMDIATATQETIKPPDDIKEKMKVHGASSTWFGKETLMLVGGSEPPLGNGGRCLIVYSSLDIESDICALEECVTIQGIETDGIMIKCNVCKKWIHKYCDKKMRKVKKIPDLYTCPNCQADNSQGGSTRRGRR